MPPRQIYQLRIFLRYTKPPVWRRVLVRPSMRLDALHHLIQMVMGWEDGHLHMFRKGGQNYSIPSPWDDDFRMPGMPRDLDARNHQVGQLLKREKDWMSYIYDFGDSWHHKVTLQKILPYARSVRVPACTGGRRRCPPEDCGGIPGFYGMLQALSDPADPNHEHMMEWLGEPFDPEDFSHEEVDATVAKVRW